MLVLTFQFLNGQIFPKWIDIVTIQIHTCEHYQS